MAKVIVMYEKPKDQEKFEEYYFNTHMPKVEKVPNVKSAKVQRVLSNQNTDLALYLITEIEFENKRDMKEAFASEQWKAVEDDVPNFMKYLEKPPIITIVD
ncbi:EthD family reductase [Rossellomorea aquimaris]|uniref:EthD family reductase n=1 Tax=Rossellomorea TaxID=2837508 RepID=UPI001CD302B4|nr:EthD family reductase [Rossellomorea aquimaris]MCA1058233.1 EthD family reductase [Rossellomorea aquimaris]